MGDKIFLVGAKIDEKTYPWFSRTRSFVCGVYGFSRNRPKTRI